MQTVLRLFFCSSQRLMGWLGWDLSGQTEYLLEIVLIQTRANPTGEPWILENPPSLRSSVDCVQDRGHEDSITVERRIGSRGRRKSTSTSSLTHRSYPLCSERSSCPACRRVSDSQPSAAISTTTVVAIKDQLGGDLSRVFFFTPTLDCVELWGGSWVDWWRREDGTLRLLGTNGIYEGQSAHIKKPTSREAGMLHSNKMGPRGAQGYGERANPKALAPERKGLP